MKPLTIDRWIYNMPRTVLVQKFRCTKCQRLWDFWNQAKTCEDQHDSKKTEVPDDWPSNGAYPALLKEQAE